MEIKGFKAFNSDRTNNYGIPFEEGKSYRATGEIKFGIYGNGYHMCTSLCDVFRYFVYTEEDEVQVAEVTGRGQCYRYDDDYNGYYAMYACEEITIDRFMTREEVILRMLEANEVDMQKFLMTFRLREDEKVLFLRKFRNNITLLEWLLYFQYGYKGIFEEMFGKSIEEQLDFTEQIRMVLDNGQDNNKGS